MSDDDLTTEELRDLHNGRYGRYWNSRFDSWLAQRDAEVAKMERKRIAKEVWEEKQRVFEETVKDPTNSQLLAYQSGIWRVLDIIEGENE